MAYQYAQTGNRIYLFDQGGRLVGEYDLDGKAIEETVYLGDQPIVVLKPPAVSVGNPDQVDLGTDTGLDFGATGKTSGQVGASAAAGTEVFYVYADHLGTPRWIARRASDNKVVWRWETAEAFGNSSPNDNPGGLGTFVYNRRFPGQIWDATLEVNYNYFRDYDPRTGRYLQSDPIGLAGGINTYAYVAGDPLSKSDPSGLAFTMTVNGNKVTIIIPVTYVGPGATPGRIAAWNQAISRTWSGSFDGYNVTTTAISAPGNTITVPLTTPSGRAWHSSIGGSTGIWPATLTDLDVAHEAGHILDLGDRYYTNPRNYGQAINDWKNGDWRGNIMGDTKNGKVDGRNIKTIIDRWTWRRTPGAPFCEPW